MSEPENILVALSGGVDSAIAAYLLREQGHRVSAAYMRTWMNEEGGAIFDDCPWEEDIRMAKSVSEHLGIPFEVVNLIDAYRERVVDYMVEGYRSGITPNPDIMCNREMKFGIFRDYAKANGFSKVATGHYVRRGEHPDGSAAILEGLDKNKDQSYFLAMVQPEQIVDALFPLGELTKPEVRGLADTLKLPNAHRKDSQGICFLGKVRIADFLSHYIEDSPGEIVSRDNTILGEHRGLHRYTIGQRRGMGIPSNTDNENYVVVAKDYQTNRLVVAFDKPDTPGLYKTEHPVHSFNWMYDRPKSHAKLLVRPRFRDPACPVELHLNGQDSGILMFQEPQRALTPGQVAAFYNGETLYGGAYYG